MTIIERILRFLTYSEETEEFPLLDLHFVMLIVFNVISIISFTLFSLIEYLISGFTLNCIIILIAVFLLIINLLFALQKKHLNLVKITYLSVIGLLGFYILIKPTFDIVMSLYLMVPINLFFILGIKKGKSLSLIYFAMSFLIMFLPYIFSIGAQIDFKIIGILSVAYIAIHYCVYFYEFSRENYIKIINEKFKNSKNIILQKDKFLSKLSHQIRTPLNNIMVVTNIVNNSDLSQKQRDLIDTIQASANNLANVVNNISEFSTVEVSESSEYSVDFDLLPTIENTLKIFSQQNDDKISFSLKIPDELRQNIIGNPIKIKQIFLNLIESILKNKTELEIEIEIKANVVKRENDKLKVLYEISSNQPLQASMGDSKKQYVSTISSSDKQASDLVNILDISIANRIIELEGEKIVIDLSEEKTSFSFVLNLLQSTTTSVETGSQKDSKIEAGSQKLLKDANVLLVEDNIINQKIVILSLKKSVKNIDVANNGKEALDMFGTTKFDIILMDIQMPIMNGIVTTKKIREIESSINTHTPIIAITANALLGDKENCIEAGMDDYISKPFQIEVLIKKMQNQLNK